MVSETGVQLPPVKPPTPLDRMKEELGAPPAGSVEEDSEVRGRFRGD